MAKDLFSEMDFDFNFNQQTKPVDNVVGATALQPQPAQQHTSQKPVVAQGPIDYKVALQKLKQIEKEISDMFIEREEMIKVMILSLISQMPAFFGGPPGTAKTDLTSKLCARIVSGNYFSFLFNKTSDPAEVFGPVSLTAMERDQFLRKTQGYLPEAHIFYGDEIWKANSPILNLLLPIINEREFINDGKKYKIPLLTMFASSNEFPEDPGLSAIYDRFVFRMWVDYLKDNGSKKKMIQGRLKSNNGTLAVKSVSTITIEELKELNKQAKMVTVADTIISTMLKLVNSVSKLGFKLSDRKLNQCLDVIQVHALYSGRAHVSTDDFIALKYVFFDEGINIADIETEILKLVDPYTDEIGKCFKQYKEMKDDLDKVTDKQERVTKIVEIDKNLDTVITNMSNSINKAKMAGKDIVEYTKKLDEITNFKNNLMNMALGRNVNQNNATADATPFDAGF